MTTETNPTGELRVFDHRPLNRIAYDIYKDWKTPSFSARPYLEAMEELQSINDTYWNDSAKTVVLYFLANAGTWRGEEARRIKTELKKLAGIK